MDGGGGWGKGMCACLIFVVVSSIPCTTCLIKGERESTFFVVQRKYNICGERTVQWSNRISGVLE